MSEPLDIDELERDYALELEITPCITCTEEFRVDALIAEVRRLRAEAVECPECKERRERREGLEFTRRVSESLRADGYAPDGTRHD